MRPRVDGVSVLRARPMSHGHPGSRLPGRRNECEALDRLLATARAGKSSVLVLRGESGIGKSALLKYVLERASGCRIARAGGVESEMELAFAGLQQLCASMLRIVCWSALQSSVCCPKWPMSGPWSA